MRIAQTIGFGYPAQAPRVSFACNSSLWIKKTAAAFGGLSATTFTIAGWFKRIATGPHAYNGILSFGDINDTNDVAFKILLDASNEFEFTAYRAGAVNGRVHSNTTTFAKEEKAWHNFCIHYDATNGTAADRLKCEVDGSNSGFSFTNVSNTAGTNTPTGDFVIGGVNESGSPGKGMNGLLAMIGIWNNTLIPFSSLYSSGFIDYRNIPSAKTLLPFNFPVGIDAADNSEWVEKVAPGSIFYSSDVPV